MVAKRLVGWPLLRVVAASLLLMTAGTALSQSDYKPSPITKVVLLGRELQVPTPSGRGRVSPSSSTTLLTSLTWALALSDAPRPPTGRE